MKKTDSFRPLGLSQLNKAHRRRKWWQQAVSFMAAIVVFCTTYSLILNAITQELSPDPDPHRFMINGVETDGTYTWENADAGMSAEVTLHGNAAYVGTLPDHPDWQLLLSFEDVDSLTWLEEQTDGEAAVPLMAFNMTLMSDDGNGNKAELLLDNCTADVTLSLRHELLESAVEPMLANIASDEDTRNAPSEDTPLSLSVLSEDGELAGVDLPVTDDWVTLTYSVRANDTVTTVLDANPHYLLQHYINFPGFDITTTKPSDSDALPFRNMSSGEPLVGLDGLGKKTIQWIDRTEAQLKTEGKLFYVILNSDGSPKSKTTLQRLMADEATHYRANPQLRYMNRLYNGVDDYNANYKLKEIWISKTSAVGKDSVNINDFNIYDVSGYKNPDRIRFTNNPNNSHIGHGASTNYPYDLTLLVPHDSIIRLVFDITTSDKDEIIESTANFFDYNIGDGYIYESDSSWNLLTKRPTSVQTFDTKRWAMNTYEQGVNSPAAFSTSTDDKASGLKFIFGNRNAGNQHIVDNTKLNGNYFNRFNNSNYQGAIFDLVKGLKYGSDGLPVPIFNDQIIAPDLFSSNEYGSTGQVGGTTFDIKWKNAYVTSYSANENGETVATSPYVLGFKRQGGTYTLDYVKNTANRIVAAETVTVDGNINDSGWKEDGWITVNKDNGTFQGGIDSMQAAASKNFSYAFQLRTDGKKLYVAAVYENITYVDSTTKLRIWLNTNSAATMYTHFYDVYLVNGEVTTVAKYNKELNLNDSGDIVNSTAVGAAKVDGSKVTFELSVDIAEFGGENGFNYFLNAGHKIANDNIQLLYPKVLEDSNSTNFPYKKWDSTKSASANINVTSDLSKFISFKFSNGSTLYSNEFWPMDNSPSHGTDGNDMMFGSKKYGSISDISAYRGHNGNQKGTFPLSDIADAQTINGVANPGNPADHNGYFGMSFSRTFTVEPGYRVPMSYWFYGDDDLWVFLEKLDKDGNPVSQQKIADLGGVHTSVGEYVNLWDYIEPIDYDGEAQDYRLTVFYIERGASGSCCYMRMVLPLESKVTAEPNRDEALVFEKQVLGENGKPVPYDANGTEYQFELRLFNEQGADFEDAYDYAIYKSYEVDGTRTDHKKYDDYSSGTPPDVLVKSGVLMTYEGESGKYRFSLRSGEYIVIRNLPGDMSSDGIIGIDTYYSIRELRNAEDGLVTQYSLGTHTHGDDEQIDTPLSAARYDYSLGNEQHIHLRTYNYVLFTNSPLLKTELSPGNGKGVYVGKEIVYEIEWANDTHSSTDIIVTDPLDEGVDFVGAALSSANVADANEIWWMYDGEEMRYSDIVNGFSITYNPTTHTVTWRLRNRDTEAYGIVSLRVRVNKKALKEETDAGSFGTTTARVENYAIVNIGDRELITNKVENPVWEPIKDEPTPGAGATVADGYELFYTITWKNYLNEPASVTVRDPLDNRVSYIADTAKVYYGVYGSGGVSELKNALVSYDAETHTLNWDLGVQPAGAEGYVCFSVTVHEPDYTGGIIWNWGYVKVGGDDEIETNHINNPLYGYLLPTTGGIGREVYPALGVVLILLAAVLLLKGRSNSTKKEKI